LHFSFSLGIEALLFYFSLLSSPFFFNDINNDFLLGRWTVISRKKSGPKEAAIFKSLKCHVTIIAIFKRVFYEGSNSSLLSVGAY
jgi:hypothetical protein